MKFRASRLLLIRQRSVWEHLGPIDRRRMTVVLFE